MWDYILGIFILLSVIGIIGTLLYLHVNFWIDVDHQILAFLTLPFFVIFGLIQLVIEIKCSIEKLKL